MKTMGIPYKYERPLVLRTIGKVHPDFTVLNVRTREEFVWEHFGMMDDPGYCERNLGKIVAYEKDGFFPGKNFIMTFETKEHPLNTKIIDKLVENFLV